MSAEITIHPLFAGLTRPPMRFGVTITFLMMNGMSCLLVFILSGSFVAAGVLCALMHSFGYVCCLFDPRMFDILLGRLKTSQCTNRNYWRCNSYEPF